MCEGGSSSVDYSPLYQWLDGGGVDVLLLAVGVEDKVVGEGLVLAQHNLGLAGGAGCADSAHVDLLTGILGTDPTEDRGGGGGGKGAGGRNMM